MPGLNHQTAQPPPSVAMPLVAGIVLNYNNYGETISCVRALLQQRYESLSCVIVDNASPNDSLEHLMTTFAAENRVNIVRAPDNGGYASGNNFGAHWAIEKINPEYLLILNPDVVLSDRQSIARLVDFAGTRPDAAVVSPKVVLPNGFVQGPYERPSLARLCVDHLFPVLWHFRRQRHQRKYRKCKTPQRCFRTIGACMLVRTETFVHAGMFDEQTFMGGEEPILAEKYNSDGKYFYHYPGVSVTHNHTRSSPYTEGIEPLAYYFREYRGSSELSIALLRSSSRFYAKVYEPLKSKLYFVR